MAHQTIADVPEEVPWRETVQDAVVPFLAWRTALFALAAFVNSYLLPASVNAGLQAHGWRIFWQPWYRFDATFYEGIAQHGYSSNSGPEWAFYPLYPYLVKIVAAPFGGGVTATVVVAILIANMAAVAAVAVLYLLVRDEWGRDVARRTAIYFSVFPLAFYLSAPYAESLFVLLAVSCLYLTRQHRWLAAGAVGALAAATRPPGLTLAAVILCELVFTAYRDRKDGYSMDLLRPAVAVALVPTGLLAFMAVGKQVTGDWLVTFHVNADVWHRKLGFPWQAIHSGFQTAHWGRPGEYLFGLLNLTIIALWLVALALMVKRFPPTYTVFTAALMVLTVTAGSMQSVGRHTLTLVPALVLIAIATKSEASNKHQITVMASAGLCAVFMVLYVLQIPAIA